MTNPSAVLKQLLRDEMRAQGLTGAALADRAGIKPSTLWTALGDRHGITVATADKLARAMGRIIVYRLEPTP